MKITGATLIPLRCQLDNPLMDARAFFRSREGLLLVLKTDEGLQGIGEAAVFGGAIQSIIAILKSEFLNLLIGEDPFDIERIWETLYQRTSQHGRRGLIAMAISAVDTALWDLVGKALGKPLYKILGGFRDSVPAYASGGFYAEGKGIEELQEEMKGYIEKGFKAVKMKVARTPSFVLQESQRCRTSIEYDLQRVKTVREAIGEETALMLDANNGWDVKTAISFMERAKEYCPYFIEEPVPTDDLEGSICVASRIDTPVAGYETLFTKFEYAPFIERRAIDIVQPDVTWTGGITEARKIAIHAGIRHRQCFPHSFSTAVGLAASLHLLASIPNGGMLEVDGNPNPLREEIVREPLKVTAAGMVELRNEPGLGLTLNEQALRKYTIKT